MATVSNTEGIQLTAIMTPPHNITLYATDNAIDSEALKCLMNELRATEIPGVMTEKSLAVAFAEEYTSPKRMTYVTAMNQCIYELNAVNPNIQKAGNVRLLEEEDMHFFPYWLEAFNAAKNYGATKMSIPNRMEAYQNHISSKKLYILEDNGQPVSMAGFTRIMQTAIGVAYVYTPPCYRGRGYATSIVAQISQIALAKGFDKCVLYTDLANPTSNSIYKNIGYVPVCESLMLKFE